MVIGMKSKVFMSESGDLIEELKSCCRSVNDYANISSALVRQAESRMTALDDEMQFLSDADRISYLVETIVIVEQLKAYVSMCKDAIKKGNEISLKIGV